MNKVSTYGDKLLVLNNDNASLSIWSVEDCRESLKNWKPVKLIETKAINADWLDKFNKMWEQTGKVEIAINN